MLYWGYAHFDECGPFLLLSHSRRKVSLCFHKVVSDLMVTNEVQRETLEVVYMQHVDDIPVHVCINIDGMII